MSYSLGELFMHGGLMMWPLLLCSIVVVAIIVERSKFFASLSRDTDQFLSEVHQALKRNRLQEALRLCDRSKGPMSRIVQAGLTHQGQAQEDIRQAVEEASVQELPQLERNLAPLATLAHTAPLLGLTGTVLGLIRCFHVMQVKAASLQPVGPGDLAQGVWEALIATLAGLMIAIPAIVAYNYFARRVQLTLWNMETAVGSLIKTITQPSQ